MFKLCAATMKSMTMCTNKDVSEMYVRMLYGVKNFHMAVTGKLHLSL